ncbi:hypothetical protein RI065_02160 [Mycoplasmatota bacterium zrk1]
MIHFGIVVKEGKYGLKLTRDNYAIVNKRSSFRVKFSVDIYDDEEGKTYKDEWCKKHLTDCMKNFELNITYFNFLDKNQFDSEIIRFLSKNSMFIRVDDLSLYSGVSGYYIMILDNYCQLYVGTTGDIKTRIRNHWTNMKPFDRLFFPMGAVDTSLLSIDSFRAFDTTRIYAYITNFTYSEEDSYINQFSPKFVCNRMGGGKITGGLLQAIGMMKYRKL